MDLTVIVIVVVVTALAFDFTNGFHDTANAMATFGNVLSKVLLPAVLSPILAGIVALIATYLGYRIAARGREGTVKKGFKVGQIVPAPVPAGAAAAADGTGPVGGATGPVMSTAAGTALAGICLLAVAAIVVYGLALIIFHH